MQLTILIIEHDIPLVMRLSDRIIAMADGEVIAYGTPDAVKNDPAVVEAYLGGDIKVIERSDNQPRGPRPGGPPSGVGLVVPGLWAQKTKELLNAFGSVEAVRAATPAEIAALRGFGPSTARRVHEALR